MKITIIARVSRLNPWISKQTYSWCSVLVYKCKGTTNVKGLSPHRWLNSDYPSQVVRIPWERWISDFLYKQSGRKSTHFWSLIYVPETTVLELKEEPPQPQNKERSVSLPDSLATDNDTRGWELQEQTVCVDVVNSVWVCGEYKAVCLCKCFWVTTLFGTINRMISMIFFMWMLMVSSLFRNYSDFVLNRLIKGSNEMKNTQPFTADGRRRCNEHRTLWLPAFRLPLTTTCFSVCR